MAGDTAMARKVALLLWGAQTTQLLVDPPWTPAVLWDKVTLTCQGSGPPSATTWYKDGSRWWQKGPNDLTVNEIGTYRCDRPSTWLSPSVRVLNDWLVLQVPVRVLLEGDTVTLRCRVWKDTSVTGLRFYHEDKELREPLHGTELSLSPLQLHHSGSYRCGGWVGIGNSLSEKSEPVTVTVQGVPISGVSLSAQPPGGMVALGDSLVLSCAVTAGTGPLSFSWHRKGSGTPLGTGPCLELSHVGDNDSGHYHCRVSNRDSMAQSPTLNVTVLVPVANATITPGPPALQVHAGDNMTLRCSVQVGSAPVTFTWLHDGQEVAQGPLLELEDIDVGHSGTYQCVATNQLDEHRVFQALSPELALVVTAEGQVTAVAAGVGGTLVFLFLLLGVIVGWRWWHRLATRKPQDTVPPAPPEEEEVLYTQVVSTARARGPPCTTSPQVTYVELPGPHGRQQDPGDIYGNVL